MSYVYPENWVEPEKPSKTELTTQQRQSVKNKMKTYLNNKGKPILLRELIDDANKFVLSDSGKHIHDNIFSAIALEIQDEWHPFEKIEKEL